MRLLVAGDRGYIGAVLTPILRAEGHTVHGLDHGLYEGCDFLGGPADRDFNQVDTRQVGPADLAGFDAVICLAALSNDPLGRLSPGATASINVDGTLRLAHAAKAAGVQRFVFASSCSLYGAAGSAAVAEDAPMNPVTDYGESKVAAERGLHALADDDFSPVYLRNATAYGSSPRLRLDIVLNDLVALAVTTGRITLQSDGTPWRPLVHVQDIARTCLAVTEAPRELIHDEAFNVGRNEDNLQIRDVAQLVAAAVPGSTVRLAADAAPDLRDYRVSFDKLTDRFPDLRLQWTVGEGAVELRDDYLRAGLNLVPARERFIRLERIRRLQNAGLLDAELRWCSSSTPLTLSDPAPAARVGARPGEQ